MISLEVVERLAAMTEPAAQHAVAIQDDAAKGEALVLFTTAVGVSREQLAAQARQLGIQELAVPRRIIQVEALPLLGAGKVDYPRLHQMAEEV